MSHGREVRLAPIGPPPDEERRLRLFKKREIKTATPMVSVADLRAAQAVDVHNGGCAWAKSLIDNSARPSGPLIYTVASQMT